MEAQETIRRLKTLINSMEIKMLTQRSSVLVCDVVPYTTGNI